MLYVIETKTTLRLFVEIQEGDSVADMTEGVEKQLKEMYGENNVEIVDVREPTEDEQEFFNQNVSRNIEPEEFVIDANATKH